MMALTFSYTAKCLYIAETIKCQDQFQLPSFASDGHQRKKKSKNQERSVAARETLERNKS